MSARKKPKVQVPKLSLSHKYSGLLLHACEEWEKANRSCLKHSFDLLLTRDQWLQNSQELKEVLYGRSCRPI